MPGPPLFREVRPTLETGFIGILLGSTSGQTTMTGAHLAVRDIESADLASVLFRRKKKDTVKDTPAVLF